MRTKKLKKVNKTVELLSKQNYRTPFRIILTPALLIKLNKQKLNYSIFSSLLKTPKLYITNCTYKHYKGLHKVMNKALIKTMTNNEKKKWNKTRFVNDFVRHCTIKKCTHETEEHMKCCIDMARERKYIIGITEKSDIFDGIPIIILKGSETNIEYKKKTVEKILE